MGIALVFASVALVVAIAALYGAVYEANAWREHTTRLDERLTKLAANQLATQSRVDEIRGMAQTDILALDSRLRDIIAWRDGVQIRLAALQDSMAEWRRGVESWQSGIEARLSANEQLLDDMRKDQRPHPKPAARTWRGFVRDAGEAERSL